MINGDSKNLNSRTCVAPAPRAYIIGAVRFDDISTGVRDVNNSSENIEFEPLGNTFFFQMHVLYIPPRSVSRDH